MRYKRTMRFQAQSTLLLVLLCLVAFQPVLAQKKQAPSNDDYWATREERDQSGSSSLTLDERLAILGAALNSRRHVVHPADCSHFVHALYERAGFPYEYASSTDLYAGTDEFRRVATPQPGDLVVWRGHAGIAVNPAQHSFYSLLRSGPGVDSYDSPYWKRRGRPRFFRYVKSSGLRSGALRSSNDF